MRALFLLAAVLHPTDVALDDGLTIGGIVRGGRAPVSIDAVQSQLVSGGWTTPREGDALSDVDGKDHKWTRAPAPNKDGWLESDDLEAGYYSVNYISATRHIMLLSPEGASMVYVNGIPVVGDPYAYGFVTRPIVVKEGNNEFLFSCGRGRLRPRLITPDDSLLAGNDMTLPDIPEGRSPKNAWVGIELINASESSVILSRLAVGDYESNPGIILAPLSIRKVTLRLPVPANSKESASQQYELSGPTAKISFKVPFRWRKAGETYKVTFLSDIDGSVQYYAVRPALKPDAGNALILSLHGASVEATNQADAYGPKSWASIVCPTNRRPYGFDWEDWGRLDALEVLEHARKRIAHDDSRVLLTGHSMGGHGSWQLSTTFPGKFAAVGPSAGWISFASYAGGYSPENPSGPEKTFVESLSASDTMAHIQNLKNLGVYVLHGDADDNVPVAQARMMRDALKVFHTDLNYHEQPGANHWWNVQKEPGASCVDWAPMFDLFARRRLARSQEMRNLDFATAAPNISAEDYWVRIEQQTEPFQLSTVSFHVDPNLRIVTGTTFNISALTIESGKLFADDLPFTLVLDGQTLKDIRTEGHEVTLRHGKSWVQGGSIAQNEKNPLRGGGFKEALAHRCLIVYGTHGTRKENTWMLNKAKFDAESWWYRGNGDFEMLADDAYDGSSQKGRDVLLIGNQETNSAWTRLVKSSPISVTPGSIHVGDKVYNGDDKAVLFCWPTASAMVACVGVTGLPSMRLAERLPYFVSGVAYPDYTVFDGKALIQGPKGTLSAGWFDNQWRLRKG